MIREDLRAENPEINDEELEELVTRVVQKRCHKGLQLATNTHVGVAQYLDAILNQTANGGTNRGMILNAGAMQYYNCVRDAISFMYSKRKVLNDFISTVPLDR